MTCAAHVNVEFMERQEMQCTCQAAAVQAWSVYRAAVSAVPPREDFIVQKMGASCGNGKGTLRRSTLQPIQS